MTKYQCLLAVIVLRIWISYFLLMLVIVATFPHVFPTFYALFEVTALIASAISISSTCSLGF